MKKPSHRPMDVQPEQAFGGCQPMPAAALDDAIPTHAAKNGSRKTGMDPAAAAFSRKTSMKNQRAAIARKKTTIGGKLT